MPKPKIALCWAAGCGGCEIAQLGIGEKFLQLAEYADIVFWPVAMDVKYKDLAAMPDGGIEVGLINGSLRNSEQESLARLLRQKSRILVAFGTCSARGGIPGLANLFNRRQIFERVYLSYSVNNPEKTIPAPSYESPEGPLELPEMYEEVKTLSQVVPVDYFVPGCPPEERTTWLALEALINSQMPTAGSIISHNLRAVCDDCTRTRNQKKVKKFWRTYEIIPQKDVCLLEQGLVCAGIATRGGCGAPCPQANMPCTGCYGPVDVESDQGTQLMAGLTAVIDSTSPEEVKKILAEVVDPVGTFYRYGLADSWLRRAKVR